MGNAPAGKESQSHGAPCSSSKLHISPECHPQHGSRFQSCVSRIFHLGRQELLEQQGCLALSSAEMELKQHCWKQAGPWHQNTHIRLIFAKKNASGSALLK